MSNEFFGTKYWELKKDYAIPKKYGDDRNAIFTLKGMNEIAQYYREKYDIEIYPFKSTKIAAPETIKNLLAEAKKLSIHKCGFLWWDTEAKHAIPIIYEDNHLFLLDSLGEISNKEKENVLFRKSLTNLMPSITLWNCLSKRQADRSSCTTDAMIILKDGLRLQFLKTIESKKTKEPGEKNLFHLPEELLKSPQINSIIKDSHAETSKEILTGKCNKQITLEDFRKKYDIPITIYKEQKPPHSNEPNFIGNILSFFQSEPPKNFIVKKRNFGTFTLFKGKKYVELIKNRWEERNNLLNAVEKSLTHLSQILIDPEQGKNTELVNLKNRLSHYIKLMQYDGITPINHRKLRDDLAIYESLSKLISIKVSSGLS